MLMFGPARPKRPPQGKEGRYEAMGRPHQRNTARRNPRSERGASGRGERGRPSGPCLVFYHNIHIHAKSGLRAVLARRSSYAHEVNAKCLYFRSGCSGPFKAKMLASFPGLERYGAPRPTRTRPPTQIRSRT